MPPKKSRPIDLQKQAWRDESKFISVFVYSDTKQVWVKTIRQHRDFDTIILQKEQKDSIINDIDKFIKNENNYRLHNIPYRRGMFLFGPPGSGKTSIAIATATKTHRPIYCVPASLSIDALTSIPHNAVVLFEDADKIIATKDTNFREIDCEPIPITTSYPTIAPEEHHLWLRAIRANESICEDFKNDYSGLEANFDVSTNGGVSLMDSVVEGVLTDMKAGYAEPKPAERKKAGDADFYIEHKPAETEEEFKKRREMYKNIIREVNRLRLEHYDATRFDQEKIGILLQFIDGALSPYGAIFIMTTNKKQDIHSTMLRAGRMDFISEVAFMNHESIDAMLDKFNVPSDKRTSIIAKVRVPGRANSITPADLQGAIIDSIFT